MIEINPVGSRRDLGRFIDYPYERNRRDRHWIPPLRIAEREVLSPKKNPFFAHADVEFFLAWRDRRVDDRLHQEAHGDNLATFGFFEAEDQGAAQALLQRVEAWALKRGRAHVRGP